MAASAIPNGRSSLFQNNPASFPAILIVFLNQYRAYIFFNDIHYAGNLFFPDDRAYKLIFQANDVWPESFAHQHIDPT